MKLTNTPDGTPIYVYPPIGNSKPLRVDARAVATAVPFSLENISTYAGEKHQGNKKTLTRYIDAAKIVLQSLNSLNSLNSLDSLCLWECLYRWLWG